MPSRTCVHKEAPGPVAKIAKNNNDIGVEEHIARRNFKMFADKTAAHNSRRGIVWPC